MHPHGPFGPKPFLEGPLAAVAGGVLGSILGGGAATMTAMTSMSGILGGIAGSVIGGSLFGGSQMKGSSVQQIYSPAQAQAQAQAPAVAPAPTTPSVPSAPSATPTVPGLGGSATPAPTPGAGSDTTPVGAPVSTPDPTVGTDITPATPEDVAKGTLERRRKGRLSTILTKRNRLSEEDEEVERLGG